MKRFHFFCFTLGGGHFAWFLHLAFSRPESLPARILYVLGGGPVAAFIERRLRRA